MVGDGGNKTCIMETYKQGFKLKFSIETRTCKQASLGNRKTIWDPRRRIHVLHKLLLKVKVVFKVKKGEDTSISPDAGCIITSRFTQNKPGSENRDLTFNILCSIKTLGSFLRHTVFKCHKVTKWALEGWNISSWYIKWIWKSNLFKSWHLTSDVYQAVRFWYSLPSG